MNTIELTPNVLSAINCWILANDMDSYKSGDMLDSAYHKAYNAECELFNKYFPSFSAEEMKAYQTFVGKLEETGLWKSDLTIKELHGVLMV